MPRLNRRDFLRLGALGMAPQFTLARLTGFGALARGTATPSPSPLPPATKSMRGLFALMKPNDDAIPDELLSSPSVTGITLQIDWATLQPAPTVVAWDVIEGALSRVKAANKVLALRPLAGVGSPAWLYDKSVGARKYTFEPASDIYHPLPYGTSVTLPLPWDAAMLKQWRIFVQTLGSQYDNNPRVVRVAVSGPMFEAAETYLPHSPNVVAGWAEAGYSLSKISEAWEATLDAYASAFKQTPFTLDLNPLPDPVDKKGDTLNGVVPVAIGQYGIKRFPGRFFVAQSDLSDIYPYLPSPIPGPAKPPALYENYEKQALKIYDYLVGLGKTWPGGFTASESRMSHTDNRIGVLIERAKALNAAYLEVPATWLTNPVNAEAFKDPIVKASSPTPPPTNTPAAKPTPTPNTVG